MAFEFEIQFNFDEFVRAAHRVGGFADQLPFVLSSILNQSVFAARRVLVDSTWPTHVKQRNTGFITQALRVERASKNNLFAAITTIGAPAGNRGHLALHATGGAKQSRKRFAIPSSTWVRRGARGVSKAQLPSTIIKQTPKRALRITDTGIFVGQGGKLHLRYLFKPSTTQPKDVPFIEDFQYTVKREMETNFAPMMARAMATRR